MGTLPTHLTSWRSGGGRYAPGTPSRATACACARGFGTPRWASESRDDGGGGCVYPPVETYAGGRKWLVVAGEVSR